MDGRQANKSHKQALTSFMLAFFDSTGVCASPYWKLKPVIVIFFEANREWKGSRRLRGRG